jgi:small subunit ribosomal protein S3
MDIDYANVFALTVYGKIGIKVWICKGEVLGQRDLNPNFVGGKSDVSDRRDRREGDEMRDPRAGGDRRGGGGGGGDRRGGGGGGDRRGGAPGGDRRNTGGGGGRRM